MDGNEHKQGGIRKDHREMNMRKVFLIKTTSIKVTRGQAVGGGASL